jgi:hypothetical protein
MRRHGKRMFSRITAHSRNLYGNTWRVRRGRASKRFSDTITMGGSPNLIPNIVREFTRTTSRTIRGFPYAQGASRSGALMRSAASSRVRNIFFLHH